MKTFAWILSFYIAILSLAPNMLGSEYFKVLDLVDRSYDKEIRLPPFKRGQIQTILIANHA